MSGSLVANIFLGAMAFYAAAFILLSLGASLDRKAFYHFSRRCLWAGIVIATAGLGVRWHESGYPPLSNMFESLVTFSSLLIWVSLLFTWRTPLPLAEAGSAVVGILMLGLASLFPTDAKPLIPALQSYWLHLHVSVAFLGESCFALSFIIAYLYCFRRLLEGRVPETLSCGIRRGEDRNADREEGLMERWVCGAVVAGIPMGFLAGMVVLAWHYSRTLSGGESGKVFLLLVLPMIMVLGGIVMIAYVFRGGFGRVADQWIPSSEVLEEYIHRTVAMGYPLFTVGALIFGMVWAEKAWGRYWGWDPKETWALITFLVYSLFLHVRLTRGWQGTWIAVLSILGFLATLFTLFGVNLLLSGLHSYATL